MTETDDPARKPMPTRTPAAEAARIDREVRLATALRDNLRKRKSQTRARSAADGEPEANDPQEPRTGRRVDADSTDKGNES